MGVVGVVGDESSGRRSEAGGGTKCAIYCYEAYVNNGLKVKEILEELSLENHRYQGT